MIRIQRVCRRCGYKGLDCSSAKDGLKEFKCQSCKMAWTEGKKLGADYKHSEPKDKSELSRNNRRLL